jgi:hypothetical protein
MAPRTGPVALVGRAGRSFMTIHVLPGSLREGFRGGRPSGNADAAERLPVTVPVRRQNADVFKAKVVQRFPEQSRGSTAPSLGFSPT